MTTDCDIMIVSHIINVVSEILRICIQGPLLILKKFIVLLHTFQHKTAYSSVIKFTCLIQGNVCEQAEGML